MPRRGWTPGRIAVFATALAYLLVFLVAPLCALLGEAFSLSAKEIWQQVTTPDALHGLGISAALAAIAVAVNAVVGVAAALVLSRQRFAGRHLVDSLMDIPLAISPVMIGLAFILVVGRGGWFAPLFDALGLKVIFSFPGLVVATLFVTLPFTVREVCNVLNEIGTDEEDAAATLGASRWQTFRMVTLPNIRHGLSCGVTLTAARSLGEFGAVLILGGAISGQTQTATTFIYAAMEERQDGATYGMSLVLALLSVALLVVLNRLKRGREEASPWA